MYFHLQTPERNNFLEEIHSESMPVASGYGEFPAGNMEGRTVDKRRPTIEIFSDISIVGNLLPMPGASLSEVLAFGNIDQKSGNFLLLITNNKFTKFLFTVCPTVFDT